MSLKVPHVNCENICQNPMGCAREGSPGDSHGLEHYSKFVTVNFIPASEWKFV